jgi:hypothetical protein
MEMSKVNELYGTQSRQVDGDTTHNGCACLCTERGQ